MFSGMSAPTPNVHVHVHEKMEEDFHFPTDYFLLEVVARNGFILPKKNSGFSAWASKDDLMKGHSMFLVFWS